MLIKAQARVIRQPFGPAPLGSPLAGRQVNPGISYVLLIVRVVA